MTEDELRVVLGILERSEGRVAWLYLDNAEHPNVTVGVGCLIATVDDARRLPFRRADGTPATPDAIATDFFRVRSMRGGLRATAYRGDLTLTDADIDALAFTRLRHAEAALPSVFPEYGSFPLGVRQALLDLAWNVGLGAWPGLRGWDRLRAALASRPPAYDVAATECTTANPDGNPWRAKRNAWRQAQFLAAQADRSGA